MFFVVPKQFTTVATWHVRTSTIINPNGSVHAYVLLWEKSEHSRFSEILYVRAGAIVTTFHWHAQLGDVHSLLQ